MSYEFWIGARYAGLARGRRHSRSGDRFVSFIAASSMAGIALGVAALIIVLSVMNGFQVQVRDRMLSVLPHIELYAPGVPHDEILGDWQQLADQAGKDSAIRGAAPFVAAQGMLARGQALQGVQLRGIDPAVENNVSDLSSQFLTGELADLEPGSFGIVLGLQLAQALRVRLNDTVMVLAPQGSISPAGFTPRMRQFTVVGVFSSGHYEYDAALAFMNVEDAARLFRDSATAVYA